MISLIVARDKKTHAIGKAGRLPWPYCRADMDRFVRLTNDQLVLMGRRTWDSLPMKARERLAVGAVVLTRGSDAGQYASPRPLSFVTLADMDQELLAHVSASDGICNVLVIGGAQIFQKTLPVADRIFLTEMDGGYDGDVFFEFDETKWYDIDEPEQADGGVFRTLERR